MLLLVVRVAPNQFRQEAVAEAYRERRVGEKKR
jgi:hypothetical protein